MSEPHRVSPRIEPPSPTAVAIEGESGALLAFGIVADLSKSGGCIWTDVLLEVGTVIHLQLSFAYPPELHRLAGRVEWSRCDAKTPLEHAYRSGVKWLEVGYTLRRRFRQLIGTAVPGPGTDRFLFERHWVVDGEWPPERRWSAAPVSEGEWRRPARGNDGITLPPGSRLWSRPETDRPASPGEGESDFPDSCPTCRLLYEGRREFWWPVSACSRCRHLRYGLPGICGCQPQHSDPEPLERMLLRERTARRGLAHVPPPSARLPVASGQ